MDGRWRNIYKNELMDQPIYLLFVFRTQCLKFSQKVSFLQYCYLVFDEIFFKLFTNTVCQE